MNFESDEFQIDLLYIIVNDGQSDKVIKIAKQNGALGETILLGQGMVCSQKHCGISSPDADKEIILIACTRKISNNVIQKLDQKINFRKHNHGIVFTIPLIKTCGLTSCNFSDRNNQRGDDKAMYQCIIVIVDRGKAENIVDIASVAGVTGATIVNARGAGIHETSKIFNIQIEPEKEIVFMIVEENFTDTVISSIRSNFKIDEPGQGVLFVQNIDQVHGLFGQ